MDRDEFLLSEFKKVLLRNAFSPVINLDKEFPHKIDLFAQIYERIIDRVGNYLPPHKWSLYRIGLVKKGSADYTCGIYKFRATENTLLIIPPHVINASTNWTADAQGYFLLFNPGFFLQRSFPYKYLAKKRILQPTVQPFIRLSAEQANEVGQIFKTILLEKNGHNLHKNELIAVKILELLISIERMYMAVHEPDDKHHSFDFVKNFTDLVEANFTKERTVHFYATALHIHPNYLNAMVKKHGGMTAKDSIQNRIVLEAKYLLHSTRLSIKEISAQLGFDDPNYFAVFFKRSEGISPIAYRESIL